MASDFAGCLSSVSALSYTRQMQVHANSDFLPAVTVDPESLRRLWAHVYEFTAQAKATAHCLDDIVRKFDSVDSLLEFENSPRTKMTALIIDGRSLDRERAILITIGRHSWAPTTVSLEGEEFDVSAVRTKVSDTVHGMKAWYSPVAKVELPLFFLGVFFFIFVVLQLMGFPEPAIRSGRSFKDALKVLLPAVSLLSGIAAVVIAVAKLRTRFFPVVSFATGQGTRRHQIDDQVRWTVFIAFLVGVAGSFAYASLSGA